MPGVKRGAQRWDLLLLLAVPLLLHAPELSGLIRSDPRLLLSGLAAGVQPGLVGGDRSYLDPNSAWTAQALGHQAAEQWLHGQVPWWNALSAVGAPLAAEMQPAALFLPFILLMHFQNGWLWLQILWQLIALIGMHRLMRQLGLSRAACLSGALLYGCNGTFAWFSHGPERVAAFLPWILVGVERCRHGGASWLLALALTGSIYAGWPETAYLDGLMIAVWTVLRLVQSAERRRFAGRVGVGVVAGLAIAAPIIWPFVQYLTLGDTGDHTHMASARLELPGIAMLLLPYANGPLGSMGRPMWVIWGTVGGYVGVAAVVLACAGARGTATEVGLRRVLAVWIVVGVARSAGSGPAIWLCNLLPLVGQTAFWRYIVPSLAMAAAVLAGLAVQDWQTAAKPRQALPSATVGLVLIAVAVWLCHPIAHALWGSDLYRVFMIASVTWAILICLGFAWLLAQRASAATLLAVMTLMFLDAGGCFMLARIGTPRAGPIDLGAVEFLQARAGLSRIVSSGGGLGVNEASWHGLAALDETMLPVPRLWSEFTHRVLHADAVTYWYLDGGSTRLARDLPALRDLGVGWLASGPTEGPAHMRSTVDAAGPRQARTLLVGVPIQGDLTAGLPGDGAIRSVGVDIGNFFGRADGRLRLSLRWPGGSASGVSSLVGSTDNAPLAFALDAPVPAAVAVHWTIAQLDGRAAAVWMFGPGDVPRFSTAMTWPGFSPQLVFKSAGKEVYRLPGAAPYWNAVRCELAWVSRTVVRTRCPVGSTLLRRELFFPGWRAWVNGRRTPVDQDGLFQRIALPAGRAEIRFHYAPPGIAWAYTAALLGLTLLGLTSLASQVKRGAGRPVGRWRRWAIRQPGGRG